MGKRAAAACQLPETSQRPRSRRKKTPDDAAAASASCFRSSSTTTGRTRQPKTPNDAALGLNSCSATPQAERRRRQGKKPSTARRLLRFCATATVQARRLRRALSAAVSWGAKRPRTVRFGPAHGSRWRDWAGLDEGPAGVIADRVLANDVADYVRFRAACLPWRRCCVDPRTRGVLEDPRLYPRHWIMLRDGYMLPLEDYAAAPHGNRHRFLNTCTGQRVWVGVPELAGHGVFRATADGLLVLHCEASNAVRVLNPLTHQMAQLPPTTGFRYTTRCAGLLDHGTVYLYFYGGGAGTMAIARPGDDRWALLDAGRELIVSTVFSAGRFYGVTASGRGIVTADMAGGGGPRLVATAEGPKPSTFRRTMDTVHLVDNGDGDLRLVHRMHRLVRDYEDSQYSCKRMYRVYRADLSTGKTTTRGCRSLEGRAIFIDLSTAGSRCPLGCFRSSAEIQST